LTERTGVDESLGILQDLLESLISDARDAAPVEAVVAEIDKHNGIVNIGDVARRYDWDTRQMRRKFVRVVGIPPKFYAKIVQVATTVAAITANDTCRIADLAQENGYYDQSHFIHDFHVFVGENPGTFLRSGSTFLRTYLARVSG
jgi:methylphosphotriester-DNA--protein-cysteine methyltransferase